MGNTQIAGTGRYLPRIVDGQIQRYLRRFGIVLIYGPKWCGKTSTGLNAAKSAVNLTERAELNKAANDPKSVLAGLRPRLVDEWQEAPDLWDIARNEVDKSGPGQFIFTGSRAVDPKLIRHSGAGRVGRVRMSTMTLFESGASVGSVSLRDLCAGRFVRAEAREIPLGEIVQAIRVGGWPGIVTNPAEARAAIANYVEDTLRQVASLGRIDYLRLIALLRSVARNNAQPVAEATIGRDASSTDAPLSHPTVSKYLRILERFYLTDSLPPLDFNLRKSAKPMTREKILLFDPAFACYFLREPTADQLFGDLKTLGPLFESLCLRDLLAYARASEMKVSYYRDKQGFEIDAVVSGGNGSWSAFEMKLNPDGVDAAARKLAAFREKLPEGVNPPTELVVIVPSGASAYRRKQDGVCVVPITALRE